MLDNRIPDDFPRYDAPLLVEFAKAILIKCGMSGPDAQTLSANLIDADVRGIDSHGIVRLAAYAQQLRSGEIRARPEIVLVERSPVSAIIDGGGGFGVIVGIKGMEWAIEAAKANGLGMVGVRNVGHFGTASYFTRWAASRGPIGIAMTNTSPVVAPAGGIEPRIGNNPISIAIPDGKGGTSFCLDIAMSVVSRGRVKIYSLAGEALPPGWALDINGQPTTDADAALGGALLPFGDYKGTGLAIAIEILTAALTGGQLTQNVRHGGFTVAGNDEHDDSRSVTIGNLFMAIDSGVFRDSSLFQADVESILTYVTGARGLPNSAVRIPGEPEMDAETDRTVYGIPLSLSTLASLMKIGEEHQVSMPNPIKRID